MAGGVGLAGLAGLGVASGAWPIRGFALLVLLGGVVAALVAAAARPAARPWPIAPGWLQVAPALVAAVLAALNLVERLDGGASPEATATLGLSAALAVVAVALLAATLRRVDLVATAAAATGVLGGVLVLAGVGLGLGVGSRAMGLATTLTVSATFLAVAAIGAAAEPGAVRLRVGGGSIAVGLVALAAVFAGVLVGTFGRSNFGLLDRAFLVVHLIGLALVAAGSVLAIRTGRAA